MTELPRAGLEKVEDVVIYADEKYYCAFPSAVRLPDGELLVAFRRAPERRLLGAESVAHADPNSQLVLVRSRDGGRNWSEKPELIYAHPLGGSQDPCLLRLRDGTLLCTGYGMCRVEPGFAQDDPARARHGDFLFLGGYILESSDGGATWRGPILPPPVPGDLARDLYGNPFPAFNRGAMCEASDGLLYWGATRRDSVEPARFSIQLLVSADRGETWKRRCTVAEDKSGGVNFNETSLYETPGGDLVAFIRTFGFGDRGAVARSSDGGRSFEPWEDAGFRGHPHHPLRLPDGRVLLTYGYRHAPYGIRARVLEPECHDAASAPEIILRDDGGNADVGYPWAAPLPDGRVLAVYYFNRDDGPRYIAGTILSPGV